MAPQTSPPDGGGCILGRCEGDTWLSAAISLLGWFLQHVGQPLHEYVWT